MDIANLWDNPASSFEARALRLFHYQAKYNSVYKKFLSLLKCEAERIKRISEIPFLPVSFFKQFKVVTNNNQKEHIWKIFESSSTTGQTPSKHYVRDLKIYENVIEKNFIRSFSNHKYKILALLPGYLERKNSSLVFMVNHLMKKFGTDGSGFYLNEFEKLQRAITDAERKKGKLFLFGVTHALVEFASQGKIKLPKDSIVLETGGMKGEGKEWVRKELHEILKAKLGAKKIFSEYGMTELLSHAYTKGTEKFFPPPWMKIFVSDVHDPFSLVKWEDTGRICIVDIANVYSCAFIQTDDLGRKFANESFEVLGRIDNSELRGCNLMI